jgi:peptidoglycan/xylan/chitin deacetylase (PgdA/CDA1 family)
LADVFAAIRALAACGVGTILGGLRPNSAIFGPVMRRGPAEPALYLTFDDGPSPGATAPILAALADAGAPACFFMIGDRVCQFPSTARDVAVAGHAIGNHTQRHPNLVWLTPPAVERGLGEAHNCIAEVTGTVPAMFRAPYGRHTPAVHRWARRHRYGVIGWWASGRDFERPGPEAIRRRIRRRLCPGAIILLHDGDYADPSGDRRQTVAALPGIIRDARDAGYAFRALPQPAESAPMPP